MHVYPPLKQAQFTFAMGTALKYDHHVMATVGYYWTNRTKKIEEEEKEQLNQWSQVLSIALHFIQKATELETQHHKIHHIQNLLEILYNATPDMMINIDLTGKVRFWNQAAEKT